MRRAGVKDVAALAGVSLGTVSNVLNRPESVMPETRRRVEKAIEELGYVRNESARQLRAGTSNLIAYVFLDVSNPFFTDVARAAADAAREASLSLVLCNTDADPAIEDDYLELLLEQRVRGVLITPADAENPRLRALAAGGVPVVVVDRFSGVGHVGCTVGVDDVEGGLLAVRHILAQGHERVAFVGRPKVIPQVVDRHAGALAAMRAAGRPESDLVVIDAASPSIVSGRAAAEALMALPAPDRPTAAFCANDLLALGLLQELLVRGVRVPDEVAIVGYDDIDLAAGAAVPLTSVRQPREEMGRTAVSLLLREAAAVGDEQHVHARVIFRPELIERASSKVGAESETREDRVPGPARARVLHRSDARAQAGRTTGEPKRLVAGG